MRWSFHAARRNLADESAADHQLMPEEERLSPTGEPHHDQIESEPWKIDAWSKKLGISATEVRQLAAQVGPVYENIERALAERISRRAENNVIKRAEREGEVVAEPKTNL
jgi:hypothetical protein